MVANLPCLDCCGKFMVVVTSVEYVQNEQLGLCVCGGAGCLVMGVELPPDAVGGHSTTAKEVQALAEHVKSKGGGGLFVWSIQKESTGLSAAQFCNLTKEVLGN
jgi:hypothetical protein